MSLNSFLLTLVFKYPTPPISFEPTFFNLSHIKSLNQYSTLFHLGLKHVPIPNSIDSVTIQNAWTVAKNKLLWKEFFANQKRSNSWYDSKLKIVKPNKPFPAHLFNQRGILPALSQVQVVIDTFTSQTVPQTRTRELNLIKRIRNTHPEIIFTASDKNLGMCAIHTQDYHSLVMNHLEDSTTYEIITNDLQTITQLIQISDILPKFKNLTTQERNFLLHPREFSLPKFHLLPKVHKKSPTLQTRPIIGATNWCTTPVSILFDSRLKQHLIKFPAVLRNSQELTKCLQNIQLQSNDWLVTMDIVSLYPNIDLNLLNFVLSSLDPSFASISDFITRNNFFIYNDQIFRQKNGIAMGTNCAVNIAQIYLGKLLDVELLEHYHLRLYKRYIDDIFTIFNGTEQELLDFFKHVNSMIPGISITYTYSKNTTEFLDLKIFKESDNSIGYNTHQKSQNKYHYLSPRSCHPIHTLSGYIKGELTRYARNSSQIYYFNHTKELFMARLLSRGYSKQYLTRIFKTVSYTRPETNLDPELPCPESTVTAFVLPYSVQLNFNAFTKTLNHIFQQVNINLKQLENTQNFKLLLVYKKNQSLGDILCRSALSKYQSTLINLIKAPPWPLGVIPSPQKPLRPQHIKGL